MPIVDLRGKQAERQAQMLQMLNQMRNRNAGQPSAMDELNKEFERQAAQKAEEDRKNRATDAQVQEGIRRGDISQWEAGQKDIHAGEESSRQERQLGGTLEHLRAQTESARAAAESSKATAGAARARTEETEVDIAGKQREQKTKATEADIERARGIVNEGIRRLATGDLLSKEDTDSIEKAHRTLSGNPALMLPRKADGSWDPPANYIRGMLDKGGIPTTKYAEGTEDLDGYESRYGKLVGDAMKARARGAGPETLALFEDKFYKENALNKNQLPWRFAKKFLDVGDFAGAKNVVEGLAAQKDLKLKMPSPAERQEFGRQTRLVDDMDMMEKEFQRLKSEGLMPVGALRQPFYQILRTIGKDHPEVSSFIKRVEQMKGEYLLYLSGRAATDAERDDLLNRIPTIFDSPQTFEMSLPQFREKVAKDISIDAGILKSFGLQIPDGIAVVDPWDIINRDGKLPNLILENGYIPHDYAEQNVRGKGLVPGIGELGGNGTNIGGKGEYRQKQLGESTESGEQPGAEPAPIDLDPMHYPDPVAARGWIKEYLKLKGGQ